MVLVIVARTITDDLGIRTLCSRLAGDNAPLAANGLWGSAAPILSGCVATAAGRPLLYLTAHLEQADCARDDIETALGRAVDLLPAWETLPGEGGGASEIGAERGRLCEELRHGDPSEARQTPRIIVAPIQAIIQPVPTPAALDANAMHLNVGRTREPDEIARWLVDRGFERLDQVEQPGDFALRGGILDVWTSGDLDPIRLEFFGDEIESIRQFEVGSQRSMRSLETVRIAVPPDPARTTIEETTTFFGYLPDTALVALHEPVEIAETAKTVLDRLGNPVGHFSFESIIKRLDRYRQLHLSRFPVASVADEQTIRLSCEPLPAFDAKAPDAVQQLILLAQNQTVVVYCDNKGEQDRLRELIEQAMSAGRLADVEVARQPCIETRIGLVHEGFQWRSSATNLWHRRPAGGSVRDSVRNTTGETPVPQDDSTGETPVPQLGSFAVLPHHELFRRYTRRRRIRKVTTSRAIESFLDLEAGDYVVHVLHGIAKYAGMKTMRKGQSRQCEEFLTLRFGEGTTMHVPVSQIDLVQKYVGAKAARPPLSKLGGKRWQATKDKVEEVITDMASDLLRIQARREAEAGTAFPQDTRWQDEFEDAFLYTETPDQTAALRDIKADQTKARPMDRLLCGDVGFGKTELAARAAFKTIEYGKQTAILVPTTVLAEQHHRTLRERMADYPFRIECLNRFRSPREQKEIIAAAKRGQVDILIGTHRLLSKDVDFADLGLVVIDEEQRFGVEHKERLKHLRSTVDVLTLTATPIPRTLHMAMIGVRDISSLSTPPMDRRAIATRVAAWNDDMIREALVRELNRDGQVFFVHNRVHSIKAVAARVAALVPDARIVIGHGQMPSDELEKVMFKFVRHEADILVCTTIIESGLDIPNANTILIDRAERYGLADLHQLRGRVGRYKHRAYCYLLLDPTKPLTNMAARRLKAIEEYSDLGAGFRIAMRDLEIRGAGNILGSEQSGQIAAVGYELYCQLLEKTVKRMRGEPADERVAVHLELDVEAYIPKAYIASDRQRMECYRRVSACRSPQDVEQLEKDLIDAFGPIPETVETLLTLTDLRVRAIRFGIRTIIKKEPDVIFQFDGEVKRLEPLFTQATGKISLPDGHTLHWRLPDHYFYGQTLLVILRNLFSKREGHRAGAGP